MDVPRVCKRKLRLDQIPERQQEYRPGLCLSHGRKACDMPRQFVQPTRPLLLRCFRPAQPQAGQAFRGAALFVLGRDFRQPHRPLGKACGPVIDDFEFPADDLPALRSNNELPEELVLVAWGSGRFSASIFNRISLKRLTACDSSRPPSCKKTSTIGNRGKLDFGSMTVSCFGKPVAVRRVMPSPASTAAQMP